MNCGRHRDTAEPGIGAVRRLLEAIEGDGAKAVRDRAIIRLLWDLGLRRGEVVSLDLEHLESERGRLAVLGKRRRGREWGDAAPRVAGRPLRLARSPGLRA